MQLRLIALICMLITGCGAVHGSVKKSVKPVPKTETKTEPIQVELVGHIAENLTRPVGDDPTPPPVPPSPTPPIEVPTLQIPSAIDGEAGSFIKITAVTNGAHVRWVSIDKGLAVFPGEMLKDSTSTVVMGTMNGQYRLLAYTALNDLPSDPVIVMVSVHGAQPPPVPVPVPVPPAPFPEPVPPAPTPVDNRVSLNNLLVITIDDVTARTPAVAKVLTDNDFWLGPNGLKSKGVMFDKLNSTNANVQSQFGEQLRLNTSATYPKGMPCVILLNKTLFQQNAAHSWLNSNPAELQLPATIAEFQTLISKYAK